MRKSTIYIVFTLVLLLIVSSVSLAQITSNTSLQDSENIPVIQALDGGYVIYQEQAVCYLQDVSSGVVVSAGSANSVFSAAFSYLSGGGNLTVRRGTYVGTSSFLMDRCNNVNVLFEDGAVLTIANGVNRSVLSLVHSSNNVFTNLHIDGNMANQKNPPLPRDAINGITVSTGSNNVFQNSFITNCRRSGIEIFGDSVAFPAYGNIIRNNLITYCGWNGVTVGAGPEVANTKVVNNEVAYVSDVGISTYGDATLIDGNYVHDTNLNDGSPRYAGATQRNNAHWGIAQEGGNGPIISNNVVVNCVGIGICFDVGRGAIIRSNNVTNCGIGISGANSGYNVISENFIANWSMPNQIGVSCGIGVYSGTNTNVSFNILMNDNKSEAVSIILYETNHCRVENNTILTDLNVVSWNSAGIRLTRTSNSVIAGNNIRATRGIVGGTASSNANTIYQNNLAYSPVSLPVWSNSGNAVLPVSPAPSVGVSPAPSVGVSPAPSVGVSPAPSVGVSPAPSVGVSPAPSVGVSPAPSVGVSPAPSVGVSPAPSVGVSSSSGVVSYSSAPARLAGGYEIYQESGVCYLRDVSTRTILRSGSANSVFSAAFSYLSGGGNLTVRRGTYVGTSSFLMDRCNNVNVLFEDGAVLTIANGVNQSVLSLVRSSNNVFTNLHIDGNMANQKNPPLPRDAINGITVSTGSNNVFQNSFITNCRRSGIEIFADNVATPAYGNIIRNNLITYCGWNGVTVGAGPEVANTKVVNNEVAYVSDVGISTYGDATLIDGNYVHDTNLNDGSPRYAGATQRNNSHWGIAQEGGNGPIISNNVVVNCVGIGICFDVGRGAIIRSNKVTNCGIGISGANSGYNVISENIITNWSNQPGVSCGIGVYSGTNTKISSNTLKNDYQSGAIPIIIYGTQQCTVENNKIVPGLYMTSDYSIGIQLTRTSNSVIANNIIQAVRAVVTDGASSNNQVQAR